MLFIIRADIVFVENSVANAFQWILGCGGGHTIDMAREMACRMLVIDFGQVFEIARCHWSNALGDRDLHAIHMVHLDKEGLVGSDGRRTVLHLVTHFLVELLDHTGLALVGDHPVLGIDHFSAGVLGGGVRCARSNGGSLGFARGANDKLREGNLKKLLLVDEVDVPDHCKQVRKSPHVAWVFIFLGKRFPMGLFLCVTVAGIRVAGEVKRDDVWHGVHLVTVTATVAPALAAMTQTAQTVVDEHGVELHVPPLRLVTMVFHCNKGSH